MKILIFHGWGATSKSNWFSWLKHELENRGIKVYCPDFPDSKTPILSEWMNSAESFDIDENTILVGHSLGTVLSLRLMEKYKVKAAFLVSALHKDEKQIEDLKNFFEQPFDFDRIKTNKIHILNSDNDPFIKTDVADNLSKLLNCRLTIFHDKEHLNKGTDNFKFPELLVLIDEIIQTC